MLYTAIFVPGTYSTGKEIYDCEISISADSFQDSVGNNNIQSILKF